MLQEHNVIVIPGLGDRHSKLIELSVGHWRNDGLEPVIHPVGWLDGQYSFEQKLHILINVIDSLIEEGKAVSLVGTSAGGSAALNAFAERREVVHRVINICGRLRVGPTTGYRSFEARSKTSSAFAESVKLYEAREGQLSVSDRKNTDG